MTNRHRHAAEEDFLERLLFPLENADYEAFVALLNESADPSAALRNLLTTPSPWER